MPTVMHNQIDTLSRLTKLLCSLVLFSACRQTSLNITDKYVEVVKPGQAFGLTQLKVTKLDSIFGYPKDEIALRVMTLISRSTEKGIGDNASAKVYFSKKNHRYKWRIWSDIFSQSYIDQDTILIQPNVWYKVHKDNGVYNTYYFIWSGQEGNFKRIVKPDPGAF